MIHCLPSLYAQRSFILFISFGKQLICVPNVNKLCLVTVKKKKTNVQIVSGFGVWEEAVEYYTHRSNIHRTDNILVIR